MTNQPQETQTTDLKERLAKAKTDKERLEVMKDYSIIAWIDYYGIKNEKGEPIDLRKDHRFLYDIFRDPAGKLAVKKAAQVGMSTAEILRNHYDAKAKKMDIIYTLPTDEDVRIFVGGKVNRIIANNPVMLADVVDKDSIEVKQVGQSIIYFRGTWTKKAAIMITADRLSHDEKDSSKQDVVADYQARLQHSKFKQIHTFSHPSVPNVGVDVEWQQSDKKEWFVKCPACEKEQILTWNTEDPKRMSIDIERKIFICKKCKAPLSDDVRRNGRWVKKIKEAEYSGYHVSLLMAPYITAEEIIKKYTEVLEGRQTMDFFYNKVLGEPWAGGGNTVTEDTILGAISKEPNRYEGRIVIGVDTGLKLRYVVGNKEGLLGYGEMTDYMPDDVNNLPLSQTLEYFLDKFPQSIMVIDAGGDIIGPRKLQAKYRGRVFLCYYRRDRKTKELTKWGEGDEFGTVTVDRNRAMQLTIDEVRERRWKLFNGDKAQWYNYWLHWSHIYRTTEEDAATQKPIFVWHRSDRDDWVHATIYWRVGISRFGAGGFVSMPEEEPERKSYLVNPDNTVTFSPEEMFKLPAVDEEEDDWRNV